MTTTGWQGLWSREYTDLPLGYGSLPVAKWDDRNRIKRVVNRDGFRQMTALFNGLIGAASGANVTATHKRVAAATQFAGGGGARTIETITDINRNTVAGDITALKEMVYGVTHKPTYVNNSVINPR